MAGVLLRLLTPGSVRFANCCVFINMQCPQAKGLMGKTHLTSLNDRFFTCNVHVGTLAQPSQISDRGMALAGRCHTVLGEFLPASTTQCSFREGEVWLELLLLGGVSGKAAFLCFLGSTSRSRDREGHCSVPLLVPRRIFFFFFSRNKNRI